MTTRQQILQLGLVNPCVRWALTQWAASELDYEQAMMEAVAMLARANADYRKSLEEAAQFRTYVINLPPESELHILDCPRCGYNPARVPIEQ